MIAKSTNLDHFGNSEGPVRIRQWRDVGEEFDWVISDCDVNIPKGVYVGSGFELFPLGNQLPIAILDSLEATKCVGAE